MGAISSSILNIDFAKKSYLLATRSATISISPTVDVDHVRLDSILSASGSDISLDTTTAYTTTSNVASVGRFTLKAGKTYRLTGSISAQGNTAVSSAVQWRDSTHAVYLGVPGNMTAPANGTSNFYQPIANAIVTPSVDILVELMFSSVSDITSTHVSAGFSGPFAYIETIEAVIPVTFPQYITGWTSYTPVFVALGTVTSASGKWRRVGDTMEGVVFCVTGTPTASALTISLPSTYAIDTAKLIGSNFDWLGDILRQDGVTMPVPSVGPFALTCNTSNTSVLYVSATPTNGSGFNNNNGNDIFGSGNGLSARFKVPISGWGSF